MPTLPLTKNKVALIDEEDFATVGSKKWTFLGDKTPYAMRQELMDDGKRHTVLLHRVLMGAAQGQEVDHINGDTLDNRRKNLRLCTRAENSRNKRLREGTVSGFKGVSWWRHTGKWRARIRADGKQKTIGYFSTKESAHAAYSAAAKILHGEFARTA